MKISKVLSLMVALLVISGGFVFAGPPPSIATSWDYSDAFQVDKSSPSAYKMQIGTRMFGLIGMSGSTANGICGLANTPAYSLACNRISTTETTMVTTKITGAFVGESISLANGQPGQLKTYILTTDGGKDFYVTPVTKTGFTDVQLNDDKDSVTLRYVDSTIGWVIEGNNGATVN